MTIPPPGPCRPVDPARRGDLPGLVFAWRRSRGEVERDPARDRGSERLEWVWVRSIGWTRPVWRWRAQADRAKGSVAASDAFFPFPDGLEVLIEAGVRAVVERGFGRDGDAIAAAKEAGITLYFSGTRHFAH